MTNEIYRGGCEVFTKNESKSIGRFRCALSQSKNDNESPSTTTGTLLDVTRPLALKLRRGRAAFVLRLDDDREAVFHVRRPHPTDGLEIVLTTALATRGVPAPADD